jgi:hypothetical protein
VLACHADGVIVIPGLHTGFKVYENCELILQLGLSVCFHQSHLASFVVVALASLPLRGLELELQDISHFFPWHFSCPVSSLLIPGALPLFLSLEYSLFFVSLTLLIHRECLIHGEYFYSEVLPSPPVCDSSFEKCLFHSLQK